MMIPQSNRSWLIKTGRILVQELRERGLESVLKLRLPSSAQEKCTDGWAVQLGKVHDRPSVKLSLWLDRFARQESRWFWVNFGSDKRSDVLSACKRLNRTYFPKIELTNSDVNDSTEFKLREPLKQRQQHLPILEKYVDGETWFGIYDRNAVVTGKWHQPFVLRAAGFIEDVAPAFSKGKHKFERLGDYATIEDRKLVAAHLRRERSAYLAALCKQRDDYICQVCDLKFDRCYGKLGRDFAEAHHKLALANQQPGVKTRVEDLITVCANCHRMLHRMDGKKNDIGKLKRIVARNRSRNSTVSSAPNPMLLGDSSSTLAMKATEFAREITSHNERQNPKPTGGSEHIKNVAAVRDLLINRGIRLEELSSTK